MRTSVVFHKINLSFALEINNITLKSDAFLIMVACKFGKITSARPVCLKAISNKLHSTKDIFLVKIEPLQRPIVSFVKIKK